MKFGVCDCAHCTMHNMQITCDVVYSIGKEIGHLRVMQISSVHLMFDL